MRRRRKRRAIARSAVMDTLELLWRVQLQLDQMEIRLEEITAMVELASSAGPAAGEPTS